MIQRVVRTNMSKFANFVRPENPTTRMRRAFLWLPWQLGGEWYWLRWVNWREEWNGWRWKKESAELL